MQDLLFLYNKTRTIGGDIISIAEKILTLTQSKYQENLSHTDIAAGYNNLGNAYNRKGEYDLAIDQYKKVLEIRLVAYKSNPNHPDIASSYNNLGIAYNRKGKYDLVIEHYEKALEILLVECKSNLNRPDIAASYNNLGAAYANKGEYGLAIDQYEKAEIKETRYLDTTDFYQVYLRWAIVFFLIWLGLKSTFMANVLQD